MDFVVGGLAGVGAGFVSNPFDVIKTRMQLQGELMARGKHAVYYKNIAHAVYMIAKHDGIMALQKGLVPALWFQIAVNGTRLGVYQHADNYGLVRDKNHKTKLTNCVVVGAISGAMGAAIGSPFQLVKTQIMSQSVKAIAVGTQHGHRGTMDAFKEVYSKNGIKGLWRGANTKMIANSVGSASQMVPFSMVKEYLIDNSWHKYTASVVASLISGFVKAVFVTPIDVVVTRLYNQGVDAKGNGLLYKGIRDCFLKINRTEGSLAFYKGFGPNYLRQAPYTFSLLVFWDILKDLQNKLA